MASIVPSGVTRRERSLMHCGQIVGNPSLGITAGKRVYRDLLPDPFLSQGVNPWPEWRCRVHSCHLRKRVHACSNGRALNWLRYCNSARGLAALVSIVNEPSPRPVLFAVKVMWPVCFDVRITARARP